MLKKWKESIEEKNLFIEKENGTGEEFWEIHHEYDTFIGEYRKLSGYLARIEHFSLGVNTGIYDEKVTERAATVYFVVLYNKLTPILSVKNQGSTNIGNFNEAKNIFHTEFSNLVSRIKHIERKNKLY